MKSNPYLPELLTIREVARKLRISESGLRKLVRQAKIPCIKFGPRTIRFEARAFAAWMASFFEIANGDRKDGSYQEAGMSILALPVQRERQEVDTVNGLRGSAKGRSESSKARAIGNVASRTAERLLEIEERNHQGS